MTTAAGVKQKATLPEREGRPPLNAAHEIDARGMYVMPGFVDAHAHGGSPQKAPDLEYVYKLWLAHGVTTVRGVGLAPMDVSLSEQRRSAANLRHLSQNEPAARCRVEP